MVLAIAAALAAIGQEADALTTIYGLYYRKPPLTEANTNPLNLGLVKHPVLLAIVKPAIALAITVPLALYVHGPIFEIFGSIPGALLAGDGLWMAIHNLLLIEK
jgi:hypothetical protein